MYKNFTISSLSRKTDLVTKIFIFFTEKHREIYNFYKLFPKFL